MNRTRVCLLAALVYVCLPLFLSAQSTKKGKVLVIVTTAKTADLAIEKELGVMTSLLQQQGFTAVIASPAAAPLAGENKSIKPDIALSDVRIADYAGFIVPCLAGANRNLPPELVPALKDAVVAGKPVAAQRTGMLALAATGMLSGKKIATLNAPPGSKPLPEEIQRHLKATLPGGPGVVQDGKLLTSAVCPMMAQMTGLPDETPALTQALIAELNRK